MSGSHHRLVFAWGPTPKSPEDARLLGCEEVKVGQLCEENASTGFHVYVHAASVPELVAFLRTLGRDCTYEVFATRQALLRVSPPIGGTR